MEKQLPHNKDAEMSVLGSIVIDPEAVTIVADILHPDDFYRDIHRSIYTAMLKLYERREAPDLITICDQLEQESKLDEVGGMAYISLLVNEVPTSSNVEYYAHIVANLAQRRRIIHAAGNMVAEAYNEENAEVTLQKAEEAIYGLGNRNIKNEVSRASTIFTEFFDLLSELPNGGSVVGVPSGFHTLDGMTRGFQPSDLIILAGRPAMGKTSCCLSIARNAAITYKSGVLLFSLEMSKRQLIQRLAGMEAGINVQKVFTKQLSDEEMTRLVNVGQQITEAPLWIDDTPGLTLAAMRSKIRRLMAQEQIDMVIVDYLQLMHATIDGKRIKDRLEEVSEVARELKNMAREFNVPILALAQLSRAVESRAEKVPQLADLRESGEIEQAADIVMFIYRDDYYAGYDKETGFSRSNRPKTADIIIAKHRNGPVGEVLLGFEASQTKFMNLEDMQQMEAYDHATRETL